LSLRSEKKFSLELGTGDVSEQFDVQDLSPQLASARGGGGTRVYCCSFSVWLPCADYPRSPGERSHQSSAS